MNKKGLVLSIEKASVHDGPGLRTTVFLKGCPLRCLWCHNPESQSFTPELYYFEEKCIHCSRCMNICRNGCHIVNGTKHVVNRSACTGCNDCVISCPYSALELKGEYMDIDSVLKEVEKDRLYYDASGGGLTVSGGEPLSQYEYTDNLLSGAKKRGFHTCLETCGYAQTDKIIGVRDYVDTFLYDYKESDPVKHKQYTGVDNELILKNLYELDKLGSKIILRCPIIPGLNDRMEHFEEIAKLADRLTNILEVNIMPYHSFGKSKSVKVGKDYPLEEIKTVDKQQADIWVTNIKEMTRVPVRKG